MSTAVLAWVRCVDRVGGSYIVDDKIMNMGMGKLEDIWRLWGVEKAVEKVVEKRLDAIKDIACNSCRSTHTGCDKEELVSRSIQNPAAQASNLQVREAFNRKDNTTG